MLAYSISTLKEISQIPGNPDRFCVIFGKLNNSRKFKNMENICKDVEKYDFYGLKEQKKIYSSLASLVRINLFLFV